MTTMSQDTIELLKGSLSNPDDRLAKSISTNTGLLAYDLQAPAKNLYPFVTPIRNSIPRIGGGTGAATNWRQVNAIIGSGFDAMGWVPEGQRSGTMSYNTSNKSANYVTIGEEDAATFEAISAGREFEDIQARMTFRLLQKMMLKEEMAILGGNASLLLGTPGTVTATSTAVPSGYPTPTLPTAVYYTRVAALTLEGFQNLGGSPLNTAANIPLGTNLISSAVVLPTTKTVTGADGKTYQLNGGISNISAEAGLVSVTVGSNALTLSVPALQGAVAYAWFVSTASGTETLQAVSTNNSVIIYAPLITGTPSWTGVNADFSANPNYAYDGLLTTALKSGNNAYVNYLATGTAGVGTPLTSSGRGSVVEIDNMMVAMWDNFELSITTLYCNAQEIKNITNKVLAGTGTTGGGPLLRYDEPAAGGGYPNVTASGVISAYYNPFAIDGGLKVPIKIHPRVPPGIILGWCENLPIQYQSNEVPNVAEVKTRQDYYQIDWPIVTRQRQVGVYAEEVLAVYAPFAMGVIANIANG